MLQVKHNLSEDSLNIPYGYGLVNNSYFCYFNSLIQALTSSIYFNNLLSKDNSQFNSLLKQLFSEISNLNSNSQRTYNIFTVGNLSYELINKLRKNGNKNFGNGQEDICEALHLLIEQMDKESLIKNEVQKENNYSSLFQCRYAEMLICSSCKKRRKVLEGERYYKEDNIFIRITPDQFEKLDKDFLNHLCTKCEKIQDLYCETCKKNTNATKFSFLTRLSEILVICFDKFFFKKKINIPLSFAIEGIEKPMKYNLVAIVDHFGNTVGGHYISQTIRKNGIFLNDDSSIKKMDKFNINENNYLVLYEREN